MITDIYRLWAKRGTRPLVARQHSYQYIYVYSTVCPSTGETYSFIASGVNTDVMNAFLQGVSEKYKDYVVVIFMDRAGWHRSKRLVVPKNIHIEFIPPYSPELDPTEQLWEYIRLHFTGNRLFSDINNLEDALLDALRQLMAKPQVVKSFANFPWIKDAELSN